MVDDREKELRTPSLGVVVASEPNEQKKEQEEEERRGLLGAPHDVCSLAWFVACRWFRGLSPI